MASRILTLNKQAPFHYVSDSIINAFASKAVQNPEDIIRDIISAGGQAMSDDEVAAEITPPVVDRINQVMRRRSMKKCSRDDDHWWRLPRQADLSAVHDRMMHAHLVAHGVTAVGWHAVVKTDAITGRTAVKYCHSEYGNFSSLQAMVRRINGKRRLRDPSEPGPSNAATIDLTADDDDDEAQRQECSICISDIAYDDLISARPCGHPFHRGCIAEHFRTTENLMHPTKHLLHCPVCVADRGTTGSSVDGVFTAHDVDALLRSKFLSVESANRLHREIALAVPCEGHLTVRCPDCPQVWYVPEATVWTDCPTPGCCTGICPKCCVRHDGTCADYRAAIAAKVDEDTRRLLAGSVNCPGPNCGMTLQKRDDKCNHIVCGGCNTHVCALCGADITNNVTSHFMIDDGPCKDRMWAATGAPVDDPVPPESDTDDEDDEDDDPPPVPSDPDDSSVDDDEHDDPPPVAFDDLLDDDERV